MVKTQTDEAPCADEEEAQKVREALAAQPAPEELETRKGMYGSDLTYMSTHAVISKMNDIFGPDRWTSRFSKPDFAGFGEEALIVYITAGVTATAGGTVFQQEGIGTGTVQRQFRKTEDGRFVEPRELLPISASALDMAIKGAESDAIKRACYKFGAAFGLDLRAPGAKTERSSGGTPAASTTEPASEKQVNFASVKLNEKIKAEGEDKALNRLPKIEGLSTAKDGDGYKVVMAPTITKKQASEVIDALLA